MLVSIFAALAALLAAVGIYGAIAFSVAQRTREFGLRMALGAMPAAIRRLTLGRTTRLTLTGAACGLAVSLVLGQLLQSALYPVPHQHSGLIYGVSIRRSAQPLGRRGHRAGASGHREPRARRPRGQSRAFRGAA
jgi:ABC-type antimicrobial peptide transport system permease subunit